MTFPSDKFKELERRKQAGEDPIKSICEVYGYFDYNGIISRKSHKETFMDKDSYLEEARKIRDTIDSVIGYKNGSVNNYLRYYAGKEQPWKKEKEYRLSNNAAFGILECLLGNYDNAKKLREVIKFNKKSYPNSPSYPFSLLVIFDYVLGNKKNANRLKEIIDEKISEIEFNYNIFDLGTYGILNSLLGSSDMKEIINGMIIAKITDDTQKIVEVGKDIASNDLLSAGILGLLAHKNIEDILMIRSIALENRDYMSLIKRYRNGDRIYTLDNSLLGILDCLLAGKKLEPIAQEPVRPSVRLVKEGKIPKKPEIYNSQIVYKGGQRQINKQIERNLTTEEKEAIELINQYGSVIDRPLVITEDTKSIKINDYFLPPKIDSIPNLYHSEGDYDFIEKPNPEYTLMKEFLDKYPQYETRAAKKIRKYYNL